jgi:hypothetical protein
MIRTEKRTSYLRLLLCLLVVSVSIFIVTGCSNNPLTPSSSTDDTQTKLDWLNNNIAGEGSALAKTVNLSQCPVLYDTTIVQTVNQYGYQMDAKFGAMDLGFSLPYMAVSKSTTLTIHVTLFQAPFGKFWLLDCGPNGQVFKYPLYVQPNAAARNGTVVVLFYYNPLTKEWIVQETDKVAANQSVQIPIYHFSKYAIS